MDVFKQCWSNWVAHPFGQPDTAEHGWIHELNSAVFGALEKNLPAHIRIKSTLRPSFFYMWANETHTANVEAHRVLLPEGTFEQRVASATDQLTRLISRSKVRTVFFYTPIIPVGPMNIDGDINRRQMVVRLCTVTCECDD